jgi:phage-related minor tail protein
MEGTSQNVFTIQELAKMVVSENQDLINIPDNILTMLLSISISHTRALMSQSALGSKFQDIIIPIVNPGDLVSKINPSIISK